MNIPIQNILLSLFLFFSFFQTDMTMAAVPANDKTAACRQLALEMESGGRRRVIIALAGKEDFDRLQDRIVAALPAGSFSVHRQMAEFRIMTLTVTAEALRILCADERVDLIRPDRLKKPAVPQNQK